MSHHILPFALAAFIAPSLIIFCFASAAGHQLHHPKDVQLKFDSSSLYPLFSWDTVPLFWHAYEPSGPFTPSELKFINRFPLVTIEKGQSIRQHPANEGAETKIVAAAKQIKSMNSSIKVLMYMNAVVDWWMYDLHQYCTNHREMWWYTDSGAPVTIFNQTVFDVRPESNRKVWIADLLNSDKSGAIDGTFVDRGLFGFNPRANNISEAEFKDYLAAHDKHMLEIQQSLGPNKIVISNNKDYLGVSGRMFEKFFMGDYDGNKPYADLLAMMAEEKAGRVVEAHAEPCNASVLNTTLAAFLIGAGKHMYYGCTDGWSVSAGWLTWYPEYSKPLGAPMGPSQTISTAKGYCNSSALQQEKYTVHSEFWVQLKHYASKVDYHRHRITKWIAAYKERHADFTGVVLGRRFSSGTCVTLDFTTDPLAPCISWADKTITGSPICSH